MSVLVSALVMQPASATYRWSPLEYSLDGQTWFDELAGSLFPDDVVLVPGESTLTTFHIGNPGGEPAHLTLTVRAAGSTGAPWADTFGVAVRAGSGPWQQLRPADGQAVVDLQIDDASTVPVTLRVAVPASAPNASMGRRLHLDVDLAPAERIG